MSRAFVINGDEWGFCVQRQMRCAGAKEDGSCMRPECTEIPEWERPKRDLKAERMKKLMEAQKKAEEAAAKAKKTGK